MATKTTEELVTQALANLGVLEAGQSPSDEDASTVENYVPATLASLSAEGIVSIDDADAISLEFFLPVAVLLAQDCAHEFGQPVDDKAKASATLRLRVMTRGQPTGEQQTTDYF